MKYRTGRKIKRSICIFLSLVLVAVWWFSLPCPLFTDPVCTVIDDRNGMLLGAKIAGDGQWRFPERRQVPYKFARAVILYEDRYFRWHPGFNPVSLLRAARQNIRAGKIVSGGSTLSMQAIRLYRKGKPRGIKEKLIEIFLATRLEYQYDKDRILALYAAHAPFGGNVVGLDAAAWRYFGTYPENLSWSESCMLAVLPNAPALIHPGRNRELLLEKRNRLLGKLRSAGVLDSLSWELACLEPLPEKPKELPQLAPHLLIRTWMEQAGKHVQTTIDRELQLKVTEIVNRHAAALSSNQIHNAACLVMDVETGAVKAYVGNTEQPDKAHANDVDMIMANRSTGSILKPFLYCSMLDQGLILPNTLLPDIPIQYSGFTPKNFSHSYDGAVHASEALSRSLNIPSVFMLQHYGLVKFHYYLKKLGLTTITRPAEHYGLSLILGGAECKLWELCGLFSSMARILKHYNQYDGSYFDQDLHFPYYHGPPPPEINILEGNIKKDNFMNASAIWHTFQSLIEVNRPLSETGWQHFSIAEKVAWKTGTSFGFRDAWAVGTNKKYTAGVWVGNADGEGRPGLVGAYAAAPILFDVFDKLEPEPWFDPPLDEMARVGVCPQSGHLAGIHCPLADTVWIPSPCLETTPCPYHRPVHLSADGQHRVHAGCYPAGRIHNQAWFILPPVWEWYYKTGHPGYRSLPPFLPDCEKEKKSEQAMDLIYPGRVTTIYVPRELEGRRSKVVFEAAHRVPETAIYWHLDDQFLGLTRYIHQLECLPDPGKHRLFLIDETGERLELDLRVLDHPKKPGI